MNNKLLYLFVLIILLGISVFVLAENITDDITSDGSGLNDTNTSQTYTLLSEGNTLINTILGLVLEKTSFITGETVEVTAKLTTEDNIPLSNEDIYFFIGNDQIGNSLTNDSGEASVYIDTSVISPGEYIVSIDYHGSEIYEVNNDYAQIIILDNTSSNNNENNIVEESTTTNEDDNPINEIITPDAPSSSDVIIDKDCSTERYFETIPIIGICEGTSMVCRNESVNESVNESCTEETKTYECITGTDNVEKTREKCVTKGYTLNSKIKFSTSGYACSIEVNKDSKIMICDSIYDGNGDGICTSGESCMKYIIDADSVQKFEKNSQDEYTPTDDSFFLEKMASQEVGK